MDMILKRVKPFQEETQEDPSEGVLEEDTVVIGGDGSMRVIVPEDLPVEQHMQVGDNPDPVQA